VLSPFLTCFNASIWRSDIIHGTRSSKRVNRHMRATIGFRTLSFTAARKLLRTLALLSIAALSASSAFAHGAIPAGPTSGIPIPLISHGEMSVISEYRGRIWDLADYAIDTNEDFRRVLNFAHIEYSLCMWGAMPGSVTEEDSPFNECSHAYLAATKNVLMRMRDMPDERSRATDLVSEIDVLLVERQLSLVLCQFSSESFNTANFIRPEWSAVPTHPASMAGLIGYGAILMAGVIGIRRVMRGAQVKA
jgi:hypothetical protein